MWEEEVTFISDRSEGAEVYTNESVQEMEFGIVNNIGFMMEKDGSLNQQEEIPMDIENSFHDDDDDNSTIFDISEEPIDSQEEEMISNNNSERSVYRKEEYFGPMASLASRFLAQTTEGSVSAIVKSGIETVGQRDVAGTWQIVHGEPFEEELFDGGDENIPCKGIHLDLTVSKGVESLQSQKIVFESEILDRKLEENQISVKLDNSSISRGKGPRLSTFLENENSGKSSCLAGVRSDKAGEEKKSKFHEKIKDSFWDETENSEDLTLDSTYDLSNDPEYGQGSSNKFATENKGAANFLCFLWAIAICIQVVLLIYYWDQLNCFFRFRHCNAAAEVETFTQKQVEPPIPMNTYEPGICNFTDNAFPHISQQCECNQAITIIPASTRDAYNLLVSETFVPTFTPSLFTAPVTLEDFNIESCDSMNLALLLLASETSSINLNEVSGSTQLQRYVIAKFYYQLNGPQWFLQESWLSTNDECTWSGVTCNNEGQITGIDLNQRNAVGQIPNDLRLLTQLETLLIDWNTLTGRIPPELFSLPNLQELDVSVNQLTGLVPSEIANATNLRRLFASGNILSGTIPTEFFRLPVLEELQLAGNLLEGSFPTEVGGSSAASSLGILRVASNFLNGVIPSELGQATLLTSLDLGFNSFTGEIPKEMFLLTNLISLSVEGNSGINGRLPTQFGSLSNIELLSISGTNMRSRLYANFQQLTNLREFRASSTLVGGDIPWQLGNLTHLTHIDLTGSRFRKTIPSEIGMLTKLTHLSLNDNNFEELLPTEIGLLTSLTTLLLAGNWLEGSVPSELGQLTRLEKLTLDHNFFVGRSPKELCGLRTNYSLEVLIADCPTTETGIVCPMPHCCTECATV